MKKEEKSWSLIREDRGGLSAAEDDALTCFDKMTKRYGDPQVAAMLTLAAAVGELRDTILLKE